jgi:hypothetical protein
LGRVRVTPFSLSLEPPQVVAHKREVATHPIRTKMRAAGSVLFARWSIVCPSREFRFAEQLTRVRGAKIAKYAPGELKVRSFSKISTAIRADLKRASVLPQERTNRLQWQMTRPRTEGEMLLAWYGPIVEEAVTRLTLNKRQGTLLIWYNPQSRRFKARGLYLCKRLGVHADLEWRWV